MNKQKYQLIKTIVFIILGIFIFIYSNTLSYNAYLLVGCLMLMYGIEDLIVRAVVKDFLIPKFANDFLIILLGIVALFLGGDEHFKSLCIIWATWGILREEWEIEEIVKHLSNKIIAIISFAESIVVIVISVFFIFEPTLHHVHLHVVILGIELILEVLFPLLNEMFKKKPNETT